MPVEKNANYTALNFSSFTGGMNTAMPPEQIVENEAQYIENYEYDFNRLRTRGGLSAPVITINNDVISSFYYDRATDSYLIFGAAGEEATAKIYHADVNSVKEIGSLTGKKRPVCCKFGGEIFIASGEKLQVYDYETLTTIESSYLCDNVLERFGRVITTHQGDDNLYYSSVGDAKSDEAWTDDSDDDSSAKFTEVGYKDDGDIIACKALASDLLVFKSNGRIYAVSGEYPNWTISQVGENSNADSTQKSIENVGSSVVFMTQDGLKSIETVQTYGNFGVGEIGYKINNDLSKKVHTPLCWNLISKRQLVISPYSGERSKLFVYQYNMDAGYILTFPVDIVDMAETANGVMVAAGNSLYRWSFDENTDNGEKIKTRLITRKLTSPYKFYTRRYDVNISGEKDGAVLITCGKKSWVHPLNRPKELKHLYDTRPDLQLDITSDDEHIITSIVLYTLST